MVQLPDDIWFEIARFIPEAELTSLYGVNRCFFELALNLRYREVYLTHLTMHSIKLLEHLKDDYLSHRVRSLIVASHLILPLGCLPVRAITPSQIEDQGTQAPPSLTIREKVTTLFRAIVSISSFRIGQNEANSQASRSAAPGLEEKSRRAELAFILEETFQRLKNVQHFELTWEKSLPGDPYDPPYPRIWQIFGGNLRNLTLYTTGDRLPHLLQSASALDGLQHFNLTLRSMSSSFDAAEKRAGNPSSLAAFLNRFGKTLESLSLQGNFDLLFGDLGHLRRLKKLRLRIHMHRQDVPNASSINRFLLLHANEIEEFSLHQTNCALISGHSFKGAPDLGLVNDIMHDVRFPRLASLDLQMGNDLDANPLLTLSSCAGKYLRNVSYHGRGLNSTQLKYFIHGFAKEGAEVPLRCLRLDIDHFNVEVLDMLAHTFPSLYSLSLAVSHNEDLPGWAFAQILSGSFEGSPRYYLDWKLYDLSLSKKSRTLLLSDEFQAATIVARHIPTVQSFNGTGGMLPPWGANRVEWAV
ncbi:hypothetical protein HGRIS_003830 [Hohenbuehelia grisea]|uniref:F-box domain-containing protein n=1 Tax=Hohenbuehelia grisea TaxID=104357 RepID=A0ABR3JGU3_9AGAR